MAATLRAARRADLGRRKETRDRRGGNLLLKKEVRISTYGASFLSRAARTKALMGLLEDMQIAGEPHRGGAGVVDGEGS